MSAATSADRSLIAAATELLAELRAAADYLDCIPEAAAGGCDEARAIVRRARAVIAKAAP